MYRLNYVTGDLLKSVKYGIIIHGCNAQGVMGSGFAKQVKETYPLAFQVYKKALVPGSWRELGSITSVEVSPGLFIVNAITQYDFGRDGRRYVRYDGVDEALRRVNQWLLDEQGNPEEISIHLPKIGAGLGGGHWPIIEQIIIHRLTSNWRTNVWEL